MMSALKLCALPLAHPVKARYIKTITLCGARHYVQTLPPLRETRGRMA